jgi:hypothetical protein
VRAQAAARVDEGAPRIADREAARREESWDDVRHHVARKRFHPVVLCSSLLFVGGRV